MRVLKESQASSVTHGIMFAFCNRAVVIDIDPGQLGANQSALEKGKLQE